VYPVNMRVRVLFFGMLKDWVGRSSDSLELPEGATLADLMSHYQGDIPRLGEYAGSLALSVNQEYAAASAVLHDNDEVALLPPVSGGGGEQVADVKAVTRAALVRERIDSRTVVEPIKRSGDGAVCIFEGIVRDNSRGRRTLYLDYEAYESMAARQLEALAAQALARFPVRDVAIVHRLGRLQIGETSVLIVVASAHRGAGFDACRWIIDTLKKTVPIWKKEYFADGAVWADGEPFPPEISTPSGSRTAKSADQTDGAGDVGLQPPPDRAGLAQHAKERCRRGSPGGVAGRAFVFWSAGIPASGCAHGSAFIFIVVFRRGRAGQDRGRHHHHRRRQAREPVCYRLGP